MFLNLHKNSEPLLGVAVKAAETVALDIACILVLLVGLVMALVLIVADWIAEHR